MKKKIIIPTSNISEGVEFFLRGAKKRRSMAIASVRQVNTDIGVNLRLVAVRQFKRDLKVVITDDLFVL